MKFRKWGKALCLCEIAVLCIFFASAVTASEPAKSTKGRVLAKPTRNVDVSIALLDVGKVKHMMLNTHLTAFDWNDEGRYAGSYNGFEYVPSVFLCIGVPDGPWAPVLVDPVTGDSASMGPSVSGICRYDLDMMDSRQSPDWGPKAGSYGNLHSGDVILGDLYDRTSLDAMPLMATSDLPATWPRDADGRPFWPGFWAKDPATGAIAMDTVAAAEFDFGNVDRPWKYVPGNDDLILVGKFSGDREAYFEMTDYDLDDQGLKYAEHDNLTEQGYALGLQVNLQGISYGRSYAEDILFFPMEIINNSQWDYHGLYVTIVDDSDVPDRPGSSSVNDNMDWMTYLATEYDSENDTTYAYNMAYIYDWRWGGGEAFPGPEYKIVPAFKLLDTPFAAEGHPHYSDGIDNDGDGLIDEPVVRDPVTNRIIDGEMLGITGWHWYSWYDRPGEVENSRTELIGYKIMSGDPTDLTTLEEDAYFHPAPDGTLDPNFDSPAGIRADYPEGLDCMFEFTTGPFDFPAGDTVMVSFALVIGEDTSDVKFNARTAQFMYELNYQGADAPSPPKVTAVAGDEQVTLYWDTSAEAAVDIMTAYSDFEGYKIYRTTSDPSLGDWGDPIYDGRGVQVGSVPIAQYDLNNTVSGLDPVYPFLNKGNNTGLMHQFTDNTVKNGVTYWYSVTAYDRGVVDDPELNPDGWAPLNYLESAKGNNPASSPNLVMVVPGKTPTNYQGPQITLEPLPSTYDGNDVIATIVDQFAVTGHSYLVSIDDSSSATKVYDVFDETTNQFVVRGGPFGSAAEGPLFDGVQITVNEVWSGVSFDPDSAEWYHQDISTPAQTNWSATGSATGDYQFDYEFRFVGADADTGFFPAVYTTPFEIWNLMTGLKAKFANFVPSTTDTTDEMKGTWTSGDELKLQEVVQEGKPAKFTWAFTLSAPPLQLDTTRIDTVWVTADSFYVDYTILETDTSVAPEVGDVLRIVSGKPFVADRDKFRLSTSKYVIHEAVKADLDRVRVVPNPYIISAEWDMDSYTNQIAFTNLPSVCDIHIFTLTGERINLIHHESDTEGWEYWNMLNFNRMEIASGMYIYIVEMPTGEKKIGKFAVVK